VLLGEAAVAQAILNAAGTPEVRYG
jgi:hypothetical protein